MECLNCGVFTLFCFYHRCAEELSESSLGVRELEKDFKVYSFYKYHEIKHLLHAKHKFHGYFIFHFLAKLSFFKFKDFFSVNEQINVIPLDDRVGNLLYSHSAILVKYLKTEFIKPIFGALHAQNHLRYSGKSLRSRQDNKRKFRLLKKTNNPVILVDGIVSSGSSLLEAKQFLEKNKISVFLAVVLADAKV